jgi:CRISPR-associated protein Cas2
MFDLPTDSPTARSAYRHFRDLLLDDGFVRLQFSVYARHCASEENASVHHKRILASLPSGGEVRFLSLTDKQFGRMQVYFGGLPRHIEQPPEQVLLL